MKVVQGWYLPNSDSHMEQYFRAIGKPEYQPAHRATAVSYCDKFRVALDIGAHVGLWARDLTDRFDTVFAFEPCLEYAELLTKNAPKAVVHRYALGSCEKSVLLETPPDNTGMTHVVRGSTGPIPMITLDSLNFSDVDFIKLDVEGYELDVIKGGINTLRDNDPVIIVEQKEKYAIPEEGPQAALKFLMKELNYKVIDRVVDDWILRKP